jgi:NAD(P)-dependent dehydrogenase (short-subunit alcohol dehydrogenase family)
MKLQGQAAIVTGGGSGLGAATATLLAAQGCRVALLDINDTAAKAHAATIGGVGIRCDVSDSASAEAAMAQARTAHGPARVLVNCAGIGVAGRVIGRDGPMKLEAFDRVIRINLIGTFNMIRLAAAEMSALDALDGEDEERGVIINTASIAAFDGQVGQAAYAASKGGVVGMTLPIARELARAGVRVMTIAPGVFHTPMVDGLPPDVLKSLGEGVPFPRRLGMPEEYAALALHIIGNRFLNGEVIRLDGALRMAPR